MASDVDRPIAERLVEHYLPVKADQIEAAFADIWRQSSSGALDASTVRLRIINVLMWGREDDAARERFGRLMDALAQRHPCRGILAAQADELKSVESAISAHCWSTSTGGRHICSEEVVLRASSGMQAELTSAVLALIVPELPVHVWLVGVPDLLNRLPREIMELTDCVYFDSAGGSDVAQSLAVIQSTLSEHPEVRLIDLEWQRGEIWRELTAQLFDGRGAALIEEITSIEVIGGAGTRSSGSLLLAGWLVSRLELTPALIESANTRTVATFYDGSRPVAVRVAPSDAGLELQSLEVHTVAATLKVELHHESGHMHIRSDWSEDPVRRVVSAGPRDDVPMLVLALEDPPNMAVYSAALRYAIELGR